MSRRKFDHFMLHVEAGTNVKLCRFTDSERCAWVFGVLPRKVSDHKMWAYFCGAVRNTLAERVERASELLAGEDN